MARLLAANKPAMVCYTLGITEHTCGKNNVVTVANLQMLLGNVGVECGGVNPLRGQNNVQGACDMGALPNVFPRISEGDRPCAPREISRRPGEYRNLPEKPGLMIPQMMDGLLNGTVKAFYVFGENLANTEPDIHHVEHCLQSAEFLVCQDIFPTETTRFAHVIFPSAAWSEDDGTFTNSERRVNRVRKVSEPPGTGKTQLVDLQGDRQTDGTFVDFQQRSGNLGQRSLPSCSVSGRDQVSTVLKETGFSGHAPMKPIPAHASCTRTDSFSCGLGQFIPVDWTPPAEVPDEEYPFVLSTGRRLYHYHTRTQTGRVAGLE